MGKGWDDSSRKPRAGAVQIGLQSPGCKAEKLLNLSTGGKEIRKQRKVSCEVTHTPYSFYSV